MLYSGSHRNTLGVAVVVVAAVEVDMVLVFAGAFPLLMDAMVVAGGASELQVFVDVGNWLGAQVRGGAGVEDSVIVGSGGGLSACTGVDSAPVDGVGNFVGCSGVSRNVPGGPACRVGLGSGVPIQICSARDTKDDCVFSKRLVTSCSSCESSASGDGSLGAGDAALERVRATGRETVRPFM